MNYFRITGYYPKENFCFILDSNGKFEKLWQFSSHLIKLGIEIVEVSKGDDILDINLTRVEEDDNHIFLRAIESGKPKYKNQIINGIAYKVIQIADKNYVPSLTNAN